MILIKNTPSDTKTRLQVFFDSHSFSSLTIQVSAARTDHTPVLTSDANKMRKSTKSNIYQSACRVTHDVDKTGLQRNAVSI